LLSPTLSKHLAALGALAVLIAAGCGKDDGAGAKGGKAPLLCYVGGTMRPAIEELAKLYEADTGQRLELDYGDSGALMIKIEQTRRGDLYVCHDPFGGGAEKKGLADRVLTVASLTPTIAVKKGNPKGIQSLRDLARPGLRLGLTDEMYSTLGHINPVMFQRAGLRKEIEANVVTRTRMGGEVANAVAIGNLDATIVWNAVAWLRRDKLDAVPIEPTLLPQPGVDAVTTPTFGVIDKSCVKVTIATLKCSRQPEAAAAFADFVNSPRGRAVFAQRGFSPAPDSTTSTPATRATTSTTTTTTTTREGGLHLYCGAGIRPPVAEAIEAFQKETGCAINADYAGSNVLLSTLRASKRGDLFMPGESEYADSAQELGLITARRDVCFFVPVILVHKGNPKGIRTLADLARPGLRLGLGNPQACAIGQVSARIFEKNKLPLDDIRKNTVVETLTVNELGVQLKTGQLDAAIVWDAIAAYYRDSAEAIPIPREQNVVSRVVIAVLASSKHPDLAKRFMDFLTSEAGQAIFKKHHYTTALPAQ